jgi:hypothetical protein
MTDLFVRKLRHGAISRTRTDGSWKAWLGLSTVHVNRTLQELRGAGLITLRGKRLTIHHLEALRDLSLLDPAYRHLDRGDGHPG